MPRRLALILAALATAASLAVATPGARADDPRQQQEKVRQQKAQAASDVNALQADAAQVQRALADLRANVAGQEALLADASLAADQAEAAAGQARANAEAATARVVVLRGEVREIAVAAYVDGRPSPHDQAAQGATDVGDVTLRTTLLGFRSANETQVLDELRTAEEDAAIQQQKAEQEAAVAEQKRAEIAQRTDQVRAARDQQAAYSSQVQARLDRRLSEAAGLEQLDKQLSATIAAQEAEIARRVAASRATSGPSPVFASFPLSTVHGITVASSIADQLGRMLDAAAADGVSLGGSGYRDPNQQQALRNRNCPDPNGSPPSACSPPTARAGSSMHERGLAIDFTEGGTVLTRGSRGFSWLSANAGRYGFANLPSEPWHWSTTGD